MLYATLMSTAVLLLIVVRQRKLRQVYQCSFKEYCRSAVVGLLNPCLYYLMLFEAYDRLPAHEAQALNYTWPIVVVILSAPLLKQPIGRISLAAIVVSSVGVFIISTRGDPLAFRLSDPVGTVLAIGSSLIWATFWLVNIRDGRDEVVKLLLNFTFGLTFVSLAAFALAGPPSLDWRGIAASAYVGVFEMGVTFVLWMRALSLSQTAARICNLVLLTPFLSLILINFLIGEMILASSVIGLLLIVGGIVISRFDHTVPRST